ncbi:MAG: RNase adapter RapZ [Burkholderiales bacterium]|nr:RNase adapter RapZ [Burkholderiales bacterium]
MLLVIVSGLSGSGKSVALNVLEDAGFYCVDNLPATLLADTVAFLRDAGYGRVAVSIDARSGAALGGLPDSVRGLKASGVDVRLLFLDAKNETLIKRFSETRRRHPLADGRRTLDESIAHERELLAAVGEIGHHLDTSEVAPNTLRGWVKDLVDVDRSGTTLLFESFGFKQGIPLDADMVFDVRCLPNPFYDPRLRPLTGLDAAVVAFLDGLPEAHRMVTDIGDFVARWLPAFQRDNRSYLTIALGCTGGQHRSVYFVERLAARFRADAPVLVRHRQLARGESA